MIACFYSDLKNLVQALHSGQIIAYPAESVFSLGCDPDNVIAVKKLLSIKRRSWEKGLILVAACYEQLQGYVDEEKLDSNIRFRVFSSWPGPITWVFPSRITTPWWLTGKHNSLAVRVSAFFPIKMLSLMFGKPIVSTSANITGQFPAKTVYEVRKKLGNAIPIMQEDVEGRLNTSSILDVVSGKIIR
ncbi:MAG: threonylcarbamoyl-AMP synthase [Candidatus Westeberhardia cardiocondylae]|nr:threonylcarbamoyl-AMP synthase [Candidatus Westeberhardia cardiocondylae]